MNTLENIPFNSVELRAIDALSKILGNRFTLQPADIIPNPYGFFALFSLSNGDNYIVNVCADDVEPQVFKQIGS